MAGERVFVGLGSNSYSFPAMFLGPRVAWTFPKVVKKADFDIGLDLGYLTLLGANGSGTGSSNTQTYSGSGFGGQIYLGNDYFFLPSFSIDLDLGYRFASVGTITYANSLGGGSGTVTKTDTPLDPALSGLTDTVDGVTDGLSSTLGGH